MLYSIGNTARFPKDHTPQVRPDLVLTVYFRFFLYLITVFITRFHIIRFSMHSCEVWEWRRRCSGCACRPYLSSSCWICSPAHWFTLSKHSLNVSKMWSIIAEKSWKGFPLIARNKALVSAVPTAAYRQSTLKASSTMTWVLISRLVIDLETADGYWAGIIIGDCHFWASVPDSLTTH